MKPRRTVGEPHDRLTRIGDEMGKVFENHPEFEEHDRCVVFLSGSKRSATALFGYDKDTDAMVDVFMHLTAVFEANGKKLMIVPLGQG